MTLSHAGLVGFLHPMRGRLCFQYDIPSYLLGNGRGCFTTPLRISACIVELGASATEFAELRGLEVSILPSISLAGSVYCFLFFISYPRRLKSMHFGRSIEEAIKTESPLYATLNAGN